MVGGLIGGGDSISKNILCRRGYPAREGQLNPSVQGLLGPGFERALGTEIFGFGL